MEGRTARLAALGAYAVVAGLLALLGLLVWLTWPVSTGGMNPGISAVTWISTSVIVVVIGAAHIALARQLLGVADRR